MYANNTGQSLLIEVTDATGGKNLWSGIGNPVSMQPFFEELASRLGNQYELGFTVPLDRKPAAEGLKIKVEGQALDVTAPKQVFVDQTGTAK